MYTLGRNRTAICKVSRVGDVRLTQCAGSLGLGKGRREQMSQSALFVFPLACYVWEIRGASFSDFQAPSRVVQLRVSWRALVCRPPVPLKLWSTARQCMQLAWRGCNKMGWRKGWGLIGLAVGMNMMYQDHNILPPNKHCQCKYVVVCRSAWARLLRRSQRPKMFCLSRTACMPCHLGYSAKGILRWTGAELLDTTPGS